MNKLLEMSGDILHWKCLLKYIKQEAKVVGGFVLERDIIRHFITPDAKSRERRRDEEKIKQALEGLYRAEWCKASLGQTPSGIGRVVTLLKYPSELANEQYQGNSEGYDNERLSV